VALSGLTMAEYFRDEEGQDVLLFIDNIFRFVQAGSEVSALARSDAVPGRLPADTRVRDGPAARAHHLDAKGSVTSVQAIYVPADDFTDPAPASVFAHLNATTALSRSIAEKGNLPCGSTRSSPRRRS